MFESAKLKVQRAKHHIVDLKIASNAFVESHPHTLSIGSDPNTGEMTVEVRFREQIPSRLSLILGDAIHNLRTALDHATWELIGIDGGTQDRWLAFPFGNNQRDYETTCNGIKTPRDDTKKFFIGLAAYLGGGRQEIYGLHLLDNADKHTVLTPTLGVTSIHQMKVVNPDGAVMATLTDNKFGMGPDGRARIMNLGRGLSVEFDQDADPTIEIFFGDVDMFEFQPVDQTVLRLADAVTDILGQFSEFVTNRT